MRLCRWLQAGKHDSVLALQSCKHLCADMAAHGPASGKDMLGSNNSVSLVGMCAGAGMSGLTADFNIAVSVNHPLFVGSYVSTILPMLGQMPQHIWQSEPSYLLPTLARYLQHHKQLLRKHNLWGRHLERFIAAGL